MQPAQQVLRAWQKVIGLMKDLKAVAAEEDSAVRARQLQKTVQMLDDLEADVIQYPRVPIACCDRLVKRMQVRSMTSFCWFA